MAGRALHCVRDRCIALAAVLLLSGGLWPANGNAGEKNPLVLENGSCRLEVDAAHGTLLRLVDKEGHRNLACPAELAENFRLVMPLPDRPENTIHGREQALSRFEASPGRLALHWDGPMKDASAKSHAIGAKMSIELGDRSLVFRFRVRNGTGQKIHEVWYPGLGGLLGFAGAGNRSDVTFNPPPNHRAHLRRPFGQHLATYPGQNMAFVEINDLGSRRAMYFGAHDPVTRFKAFHFSEVGAGEKSNVVAHLVHFPFVPPGGSFEGSPLVVQFHDGDWIDGGKKIYRPWFAKTFGLMTPDRDWIRQKSFFQFIMLMLPEGNINYNFAQIPQLARDCRKYGVHSLHISGWQRGGHDNGYPYYEPDPRLGTWADLQKALRQCHELGVKVYLFANIHVHNLDTEWYKTELKDYNCESMQGYTYAIAGWGMGTLASRMGLTTPLMSFIDPSFPKLDDRLLVYFRRMAEVGADGIHIDKCYPQPLNFNPRISMSPDRSPWEGTIRLVDRISRECRAIRPDFRISFETTWDRFLPYGDSTWWGGNMASAKRIFPELVETVGVYQPYDYLGVNDAVRNGYAVMVAPHHFNRSMDYETWRGLSSYIREVKKIRDTLADSVFFGEYLGAAGVKFHGPGPGNGIEYAVYRNRKSGKPACILTNREAAAASVTLTSFEGESSGAVRVYRPFHDSVSARMPLTVTVDAERLAFVVEE